MTDSQWPFFSVEELRCHCCGEMAMNAEFMEKILALRRGLNLPFRVTSAYRCSRHNMDVAKTGPFGPHTTGRAMDINISGPEAHSLLTLALSMKAFTGIGVSQKPETPYSGRFIHLDDLNGPEYKRPWIWGY